ncbi:hypothetical protein M9H77_15681 [Catharanthus roseus]|uniref:Uncharacterized protein n=1 Tax=Catharanthus roseus TaxID=4058 RepID=A0ACC0B116_CATRO|nr:hypothetical protein M9H77_15681 [Catharanthus roseus]
MQYITYENLPKFCSVCKLVGHNFERCFHNPKNKKELGQKTPMRISSNGKQAGKATAAGDVGETNQMQEGRGTTSNARQRDGQSLIGPKKAEENHRGKRTKTQLPEPVSVSASKGADSGGSKMAESGGDRPTADQIHSETRRERPDSVGKLFDIVKWNFAQWKVVHNFEEHEAGRMIIFWNPIMVEVQTMGLHDQVIHLQVTWKPWLVLGDFNNILELDDRIGGAQPRAYEALNFQNCCMDLGLTDITYNGARYTWNNGRIWSKIDRAMSNQRWLIEGHYAVANFLPPGCASDHSPCVVDLFHVQQFAAPRFMFFNMWADHEVFLSLVEQEWKKELFGTRQFFLCRKLKLLKKSFKALNRLEFSHIAERSKVATHELKRNQILLHDNPGDVTLRDLVKVQQKKTSFLLEAERKFCAQKTKTEFLLKGDKGTKLFHSLIKRNAKRNYVAMLGTFEASDPLEEDVLGEGPQINPQLREELRGSYTREEIKEALFDIGNEKSPGPDGYTSYFFKRAWNVIGEDFCQAIWEFFRTGKLLKQLNHCVIALIPKTKRAEKVGDFRPISCCNVTYKVITKLLANRLNKVLPFIVDKAQSAFIQGRSMVENIHLA